MTDWSHQPRAIARASAAYAAGARRILIVAPTGAGKTKIGVDMAVPSARSRGVLWLAHRQELVDQARAKLPPEIGVASVQGLAASGRRPPAGVVVLDEAHHFVADEWGAVADHYRDAITLGLTATPERADGRTLGDLFQALVVAAHYSELLSAGCIVPCDVFAPSGKRRKTLAASPEGAVLEFSKGRPSLVFTSTVSEALRASCAIPGAACLSAETPTDVRRRLVDGFRAGRVSALCSVDVLSEGFDAPNAEVAVLARGIGHVSGYLQRVGRVLRANPGKDRAVVVDLCGVFHDFGSPTEDREYSLEGAAIRRTAKSVAIWQCKSCGMCLTAAPAGRLCPSCGELMPVPEAIRVAARRLELQQQRAGHDGDQRQKAWLGLQEQAKVKGYKPGWAYFRFRARYKCDPPRSDG